MSTPAESHINKLLAPLFVEGDGVKFLTTAFQPDVEWTLTTPGAMGSGSHALAGTYKGLEAIGNVFWQLDQLFEEGKHQSELKDVIATDKKAAITMVSKGKSKKGEDIEDHICWVVELDQPEGKITKVFSYSDSALVVKSA